MEISYNIHTLMDENHIVLAYSGEFSQDLNKTLLSFIERKFKSENIEDNTRRKIFNIMVEQLQNISKNKTDYSGTVKEVAPIFLLGYDEIEYILISSNLIKNEKIPSLRCSLDQVNSLGREELRSLYKEVRLKSAFSANSGAGIGIIDMARKSENKLEYEFEAIDEGYSMFTLLIRVTKENNQ